MKGWLSALFDKTPPDERVLALEREVQTLRLELDEKKRELTILGTSSEQRRGSEVGRVRGAVQAQKEQLMAGLAVPMAQLLTQAHLLEVEGNRTWRPTGGKNGSRATSRATHRECTRWASSPTASSSHGVRSTRRRGGSSPTA